MTRDVDPVLAETGQLPLLVPITVCVMKRTSVTGVPAMRLGKSALP